MHFAENPESDQWFQIYSNWNILETIKTKRMGDSTKSDDKQMRNILYANGVLFNMDHFERVLKFIV